MVINFCKAILKDGFTIFNSQVPKRTLKQVLLVNIPAVHTDVY